MLALEIASKRCRHVGKTYHLGLFATLQETASRTGNSEGDGVEGSWEAKVVIPERWEGYRRWSRSRQEELQVREDRADKAACTTLRDVAVSSGDTG